MAPTPKSMQTVGKFPRIEGYVWYVGTCPASLYKVYIAAIDYTGNMVGYPCVLAGNKLCAVFSFAENLIPCIDVSSFEHFFLPLQVFFSP